MITIEQTPSLINLAVMGEFSLADFKQFEEHARYQLSSAGTVNLIFDLRGMLDYTPDVAWHEIKFFSQDHSYDFSKIAVVTHDQWLTWQAWIARLFVHANIQVFSDYAAAQAWVKS
ncbi:MAG: STAS/SEC14 domain-containing protein [Sideroxydans sp.]|nr:STAS/SEC14 domain-containing protein [Sideroxydans sp.]